ncbi:MAG TPA: hypothetical protein VMR81_03870 [Patescibacteria group bacterium]|nr:hypothetical protein [Patescibacteria group bacterium]
MGSSGGNIETLHNALGEHFYRAQAEMVLPKYAFLVKVEEKILQTPTMDVEKFLEPLLTPKSIHIREVGSGSLLRHGMTLSIRDYHSGEHALARLYIPTGLSKNLANPLIDKLHELEPHQKINIFRALDSLALHGFLTKPAIDMESHYYAEAEIAARTIAAVWRPRTNPFPTALVDDSGRAVGFTLMFPEAVTHARDFEIEADRVFDDPWLTTYGPSKTLPSEVIRAFDSLKQVNVKPYMEPGHREDLNSMILLDGHNKFVTFNRVGYVLDHGN